MKFHSTRHAGLSFSFREAVLHGLAPDGGLVVPEQISSLPPSFWANFSRYSPEEIAYEVAWPFLKTDFIPAQVQQIVQHTLSFSIPLVRVNSSIYSLELFHGPTLAFKDVGARFLAAVLGHLAKDEPRETTVLVATSGDTGSAVAHGFYNVPGTRVVVLYPSGKVSELQEKQFTTLGGNITALEVEGTFDDCQQLVKQAFADADLRQRVSLTSANSINIARLLPQTFYYFLAAAQLPPETPLVFSVPSGNFGNLTAGVLAQRMGLPVEKFLAATNRNDTVPVYLRTGQFDPKPSVPTISNAMDVGNPSNFERLVHLFGTQRMMAAALEGYAYSDSETRDAIRTLFRDTGYVLDPHGAIGYLACRDYATRHPNACCIFLETAHPVKFKETVEGQVGEVEVPERLRKLLTATKQSIKIPARYEALRSQF